MRRPASICCLAALAALGAAGCGGGSNRLVSPTTPSPPAFDQSRSTTTAPQTPQVATTRQAAQKLGFPGFATKNTTRIGGSDPAADAAAVAEAVFPGQSPSSRPRAVALVDGRDWRAALAASVLMSPPVRAPILLSDGTSLPSASADALSALAPTGSTTAGNAKVIRVGDTAKPSGLAATEVAGADPFTLARRLAIFESTVASQAPDAVVVVSADAPAFAMPAAAWAAKSGDPILFVTSKGVPAQTTAALRKHPRIYVLGPPSVVSPAVVKQLGKLGSVTRIAGPDPASNAIAFARYRDATFGWGVRNPGHGLVFANPTRPLDAPAAAPLSASGTYGPLLLVDRDGALPRQLASYLLDIEPGYSGDPVRGVYNHGWLVGDANAVSLAAQARIDGYLEIAPVKAPPVKTP